MTSSKFGMTGKLVAQRGRRDELLQHLLKVSELGSAMAGCLLYVIAEDAADLDTIWVTELWESEEQHAASLQSDEVRAVIGEAMPLIAAPPEGTRFRPIGGIGLS